MGFTIQQIRTTKATGPEHRGVHSAPLKSLNIIVRNARWLAFIFLDNLNGTVQYSITTVELWDLRLGVDDIFERSLANF